MKTQDIKNIARAVQQVQEKLKGDQHKLDHDKDGDIDAADFKHMRKKKKSDKDEVEMNPAKGDKKATPDMAEASSKQVDEISKDMAGRYLKKVPASAAHAGDRTGTGGMGQVGASPDVKKGYEKQRKKGISQFLKRQKGTNMAVDKLTGKAKVPAKESVDEAKKYLDQKDIKKALASIKPPKKKPTLPKAPWDKEDKMKEDTIQWPVYSRILENRAAHYKGAAAPETSDDKLKGAGAKKMKADFAGNAADPDLEKKGHDDAAKAGRAGPAGKKRSNDNSNGDKVMQKLAAAYGKVVAEK